MPRSSEFGAATRELRESRLGALAGSAVEVMAAAARHARSVSVAERAVRGFQSLSPPARLRLAALALAIAIATHLLLGIFVPAHFRPLWLMPVV